MDNRLISVNTLNKRVLKRAGLDWLRKGENKDYLCNDFVQVTATESAAFQKAATDLHRLALRAADTVAERKLWNQVGIPDHCVSLLEYSLKMHKADYLIGRFDFAGGIEGLPIKLLEYNADTCSLIPETMFVQQEHANQEYKKLKDKKPFNNWANSIAATFRMLAAQKGLDEPNILLSTLGHQEDRLNCDMIALGARKGGFEDILSIALEGVIFSPEEGIFVKDGRNEFRKYDIWFKFIPWEFPAFEEPALWKDLEQIIRNELCTVLNPPLAMLLQSKGLMQVMYDLEPNNPYLLKTSNEERNFSRGSYVSKPLFGRMGENIAVFENFGRPVYETDGDYGDFPLVYQERAQLNKDFEGHFYQPSVFYTGAPSALCFRRQDDLVIDDDAEFVGSVVE